MLSIRIACNIVSKSRNLFHGSSSPCLLSTNELKTLPHSQEPGSLRHPKSNSKVGLTWPSFIWVVSLQVLNKFRRFINLHYLVTDDPYTEHRAIHLQPISSELSGRYSCRVSSNYDDKIASKDMIIYGEGKPLDSQQPPLWVGLV